MVKANYRLLQGSILQYFRPLLSYHLSLRSLFCLFLSGLFTQVLLYLKNITASLSEGPGLQVILPWNSAGIRLYIEHLPYCIFTVNSSKLNFTLNCGIPIYVVDLTWGIGRLLNSALWQPCLLLHVIAALYLYLEPQSHFSLVLVDSSPIAL